MSELISLCPTTGTECPGRAFLIKAIEGIALTTLNAQFIDAPEGMAPETEQADRRLAYQSQSEKADALRRDLDTPCTGTGLCTPLAQTASRFMLGGKSQVEILRENGPDS